MRATLLYAVAALLFASAAANPRKERHRKLSNQFHTPSHRRLSGGHAAEKVIRAAKIGHYDEVKRYASKDTAGAFDGYKSTALHYVAMCSGHRELHKDHCPNQRHFTHTVEYDKVARHLVSLGEPIGRKDNKGLTPLHYAVQHDNVNLIKAIKEGGEKRGGRGLDWHAKNSNSITPMTYASIHGKKSVIEALVQAGVDVNREDHHGYTPIMHAAKMGKKDVVQMLLQLGADPYKESPKAKRNAVDLARYHGFKSITTLMNSHPRSHSPPPPQNNNRGRRGRNRRGRRGL